MCNSVAISIAFVYNNVIVCIYSCNCTYVRTYVVTFIALAHGRTALLNVRKFNQINHRSVAKFLNDMLNTFFYIGIMFMNNYHKVSGRCLYIRSKIIASFLRVV